MNALKELKANLKNEKKDAENKDKQFAGNAKDEEIKTLKEKQRTQLEAEHQKYEKLENRIKEVQQDHIKLIETKKKQHDDELAEIENTYQRKIREEVSNYEEFKKLQENRRNEYRREITEMIEKHNIKVREIE